MQGHCWKRSHVSQHSSSSSPGGVPATVPPAHFTCRVAVLYSIAAARAYGAAQQYSWQTGLHCCTMQPPAAVASLLGPGLPAVSVTRLSPAAGVSHITPCLQLAAGRQRHLLTVLSVFSLAAAMPACLHQSSLLLLHLPASCRDYACCHWL